MLQKTISAAKKHKFLTAIIVLAAAVGGYFAYGALGGDTSQTSYVLAAAESGTLIVSVSSSGQVSSSDQIDLKPEANGKITYVNLKNGQEVKTGELLLAIDSAEAQKSVRDAQANLENALLALQKLQAGNDQLSLLQARNSLAQAQESKRKLEDSLQKIHEDGFTSVSNAYLDLPAIMSGLNDILFLDTLQENAWNIDFYADAVKQFDEKAIQYRDDAYRTFYTARANYDKNFADYKSASRFSDNALTENLILQTYDTAKSIAEAVRNINNLIQFYQDQLSAHNLKPNTISSTHLTNIANYTSKLNSFLSSLLSAKSSLQDGKTSIINAQRTIEEKTESLANAEAGADPLDIKSQELTIQQRKNALADAKEKLADYYIRAPFDGVVVDVTAKKSGQASTGTSLATLITKQRIAEISLNEVDAAKIKTGQKATLTFDAVDGLEISGQVAQIDILGSVSQGVVSYNAKISFDTQDERVKPGMSVSSNIIIEAKQNVLLVPNSAIKNSGNAYYVQMLDKSQTQTAAASGAVTSLLSPSQIAVQVGSSNDTSTEIISGLSEGDKVISRTNSANTTATTQQNSLFGGGEAVRVIGR